MKKISISMAKGGVGKTSTAVNLSAALARAGKRVLLVDCDPQQGNATLFLGHNPNSLKITIANAINALLDLGKADFIKEAIIRQSENLGLLPANPKLEAIQNRLIAEKSNIGLFGEETEIQPHEALKTILAEIEEDYDYAILDCPPSISMLSIEEPLTKSLAHISAVKFPPYFTKSLGNTSGYSLRFLFHMPKIFLTALRTGFNQWFLALVAADSVLLPVEAHYECYEALVQTLDVIRKIKANWNPSLEIEGILLTKYQSRTRLCREIREYTQKNFASKVRVFDDAVPSSIRMAELSSMGVSIFEHSLGSEAAQAFERLAGEVARNG